MIVIDTSALFAILAGEPEQDEFNDRIAVADRCMMSAATYAETHIVVERRMGEVGTRELALYLHEAGMSIELVDRDQADLARVAYRTFGRGKHAAALNFGDCFSYALAKRLGVPLLYKGDDFSKTDILRAW